MPPRATAAHQCGLARSGFPDRALFLFFHQRGLLGCQMPFKRLRRLRASERNRRQAPCSSNVFDLKAFANDIWPFAMACCINPPITARRSTLARATVRTVKRIGSPHGLQAECMREVCEISQHHDVRLPLTDSSCLFCHTHGKHVPSAPSRSNKPWRNTSCNHNAHMEPAPRAAPPSLVVFPARFPKKTLVAATTSVCRVRDTMPFDLVRTSLSFASLITHR
ncbi:hypothetical protein QO004_004148 [Rhizobium mesoamericanum]|nr:hypothetical protein [Rhizobium mesoamericanum]